MLEMPDLILSVHSFLELLRRDTREWCRLVGDNPEGMQAQELRDRLLSACDLYLLQSYELRRRLQVGSHVLLLRVHRHALHIAVG